MAAATFALALPGIAHATTFTVDAASDEADAALNGVCDTGSGHCTLRAAIQEANNTSGLDDIHFAIGTTAPVTIAPQAKLPAITDPVAIDGTTQPGILFMRPMVEIDATAESGGDGLQFDTGSGGSVVHGLIINRSPGYGLRLAAPVTVTGNWIGTNTAGDGAAANAAGGIIVAAGGAQSSIGVAGQLRNLISGNTGEGVVVTAGPVSIENNYIGTAVSGSAPLGNGTAGIRISDGASGDVIGGSSSGSANNIGGNSGAGIVVDGSSDVQIVGNLIGAGWNNVFAVGNAGPGISLTNAPNARVGSTSSSVTRNVISANAGSGIVVGAGSTGAAINGNYVGLRPDATAIGAGALGNFGNSGDGIEIHASGASVGIGLRNVISGQGGAGVRIAASGATLENNYIGTDISGLCPAGNGTQGIVVEGVTGATIGAPGAGNVVSASADSQLRLDGTIGVVVRGNTFGSGGPLLGSINVGGTSPAVALVNGTSGTVFGGTGSGEPNIVVGQQGVGPGIAMSGTAGAGNRIRANSITLNGGLGIDLGNNGITPDDAGDADTGWNSLQNYPVITDAVRSEDTVRLEGYLDTSPGVATYDLDFFLSPACDDSGNGEGVAYVATRQVQTNSSGHAAFVFDLPASSTALTSVATATATSPGGDTSEFSRCSPSPFTGTLELRPSAMPVREPGSSVTLDVVRRYGTAGTISIDYTTSDGTATSPSDYIGTTATLVFAPGETVKQIVIPIVDDRLFEGDETFTVTLTNPVLTSIPGPMKTSQVTIIDNDPYRPDAQAVAGVKIGGTPAAKAAAKKCKVPKLRGLTRKKATAKLKKAGCKVGKVRKSKKKVRNKKLRKKVVAQKPKAGKKVKRGTKVALTLGR